MLSIDPPWSRRRFLIGAGLSVVCTALANPVRAQPTDPTAPGFRVIRARPGAARLRGGGETAIWGFDGVVPGPTLRVRRGEELKVRLLNELSEPTAIHWHGIRNTNAMDGVPGLTQDPVAPGASFDYRFTPPDAGTFWYHPLANAPLERGRRLHGLLIVDEPRPVDVDQDVAIVLDDWAVESDAAELTVNGAPSLDFPVRTNERLRLRILNAAYSRTIVLRVGGHSAAVMAIDGEPAEPFLARDSRVTLAPGNRIDLFIDTKLDLGSIAPITIETAHGDAELARLVYQAGAPARPAPRMGLPALPPNPLPERMDFERALKVAVKISALPELTAELLGGGHWPSVTESSGPPPSRAAPAMIGLGSIVITKDGRLVAVTHSEQPSRTIGPTGKPLPPAGAGPPPLSVKRGRTVMLAFWNGTAFPHVAYLHGHHFRLLDKLDDGWKPFWLDSVLVPPRQTVRIAFVADNPGKWVLRCRSLGPQEAEPAGWFEVT
jgi:FtsP/CotA-like multicopper oxidase with cupredoxin domain